MSEPSVDCRSCVHFWITHRAERPYGCRCFEFVSARLPALEILASSGRDCLGYERRDGAGPRPQARPPRA